MDKSGLRNRRGGGRHGTSSPFVGTPVKVSASLCLDIDMGSPLKGHHMVNTNITGAASALGHRAPFGDMTNSASAKCENNNQLAIKPPASWGITSKNKAGELGMETFKKFLEKKRSNSVGGGGGSANNRSGKLGALPPSSSSSLQHQQHQHLQPSTQSNSMAASLDRAMTSFGDMAMKTIVGSPDHRIQVQNAETVKSPWSYQLQVPLWPLNMKLGISVEEENEDGHDGEGKNERRTTVMDNGQGNALRDQFHDGNYMREKLFSAYDLTEITEDAQQQPHKAKGKSGWKKPSKVTASKEEEEEVKLPTPTLLAKQNNKSPSKKSLAAAVDPFGSVPSEQGAQDIRVTVENEESTKLASAESSQVNEVTLLSFDVESQSGFGKSNQDDNVMEQKLDLDSVPLFAVEEEAASSDKEGNNSMNDAASAHVDIEMAPPVQITAVCTETVLREVSEAPVAKEEVHLSSQIEPKDNAEEKKEVEEKTEAEERKSQPPPPPPRRARSESLTFVNPLVHQFCATPAKDSTKEAVKTEPALEADVVDEETRSVEAAGRIANAFRLHMFGKVMGIMAQLRKDNQKLISLSGPTGSSYQNLHFRYKAVSECIATGSTSLSSCISGAVQLSGEMEQAIQALADSNEKMRKYQKRLERHQKREEASVTIQRMWREKKAIEKRKQVLSSARRTIAASKIQNTWRSHMKKVQASPLQRTTSKTEETSLQNTLNVTPVQSWADAMDASSLEKKKQLKVEEAKAVPSETNQSESLREELASLRKELEMLRSEVKLNENKQKRGRSATRHRSRNRNQRSFSSSRGQNANQHTQAGQENTEKPKKSRSLSRGRRRRRNSFSNPGTPLRSNPNQTVALSNQNAVTESAPKPKKEQKKGRKQSSLQKEKQKENRNELVEDFTMNCPPPGLSAPPGLASLMSNQRKKMGEKQKSRSNLAASFYNSKSK